ncbi:hypothetical protein BU15DRAFT_81694 [Melanogaster broomeanus]|nr:hypothetical protein BU15DRAFT_81694 [Melanogaster broomeanus]
MDPFKFLEPLSNRGLQRSTFQPSTYMHGSGAHGSMNLQQVQHCQSCQLLEAHISKLQAERDLIQSMYQNLLVQIQSASESNNALVAKRPTPLTHPKVRWWKRSTFDDFMLSPEGAVANLGPAPYLETEDGKPVSPERLKAIRQTLRGAWTELANQGKAPQTWGMLSASASDLFNSLILTAHPLFQLAEDNWKLKMLATQSYPAWRAGHLDEDGRLLVKGKKVVKAEDEESSISGHPQKCKRSSNSLPTTSLARKRFKGEKELPPCLTPPPPSESSPLISNSEPEDYNVPIIHESCDDPKDEISTTGLPPHENMNTDEQTPPNEERRALSPTSLVPPPTGPTPPPTGPTPPPTGPTPPPTGPTPPPTGPTPSPAGLVPSPDSVSLDETTFRDRLPASLSTSSSKGNPPQSGSQQESEAKQDEKTKKKRFLNPLSTEALTAASFTIPTLPRASPVPNHPATKTKEDTAANEDANKATESAGTGKTTTSNNADREDNPIATKKRTSRKYVWRPGTKKDGKTLCAVRWLKQTQIGGTGTEFKSYYDKLLNAKQRKEYHDEAQILVSAGKWTTDTDVCDGPVY